MLTALPLPSIIPTYANDCCYSRAFPTPWRRGDFGVPTQCAPHADALTIQRTHRSRVHANSLADALQDKHPNAITIRHLNRDSYRDTYPNHHPHTDTHTYSQRPAGCCATSL